MTDKNTSTLQSYVDSAKGAAQSALGSVTGSTADQTQANQRKAEAEAKSDFSHTTAKAGPFTATTSGVTKDNQDRTQGSWNQTVGSGKETLGNLIGNESLKQQGIQQNREGQEQEARGQLSDLGSGIKDRVGGTVGGAVAGFTGDEATKESAQEQHDRGKTQQRGVEADLQKQADARQ